MKRDNKKELTNQEMAMFCDQIAMILDAGISPAEGVAIMIEDTEDIDGKIILNSIYERVEEGESFHSALEATNVFPKYALDMIGIGEQSGKLEEVMSALAYHYNREEVIARAIKNAVTYPLIIVCMMLVVILVLIVKVLPIFNDVFMQLGSEMTGFSKGLLDFGNAISKYSFVFIAVLVVLIVLYFLVSKTEKGKALFTRFCAWFVATRTLYEKIASGRFASGMALTMSAGLDTDDSLLQVKELVDNTAMAAKIDSARSYIEEGQSFSEALSAAGVFSSMYSKMINVGFRTGSTDKVLEKIAEGYQEEVDERINNMISILEPTLVIILSLVVCMILLSVMLPLMGIMSSIG